MTPVNINSCFMFCLFAKVISETTDPVVMFESVKRLFILMFSKDTGRQKIRLDNI